MHIKGYNSFFLFLFRRPYSYGGEHEKQRSEITPIAPLPRLTGRPARWSLAFRRNSLHVYARRTLLHTRVPTCAYMCVFGQNRSVKLNPRNAAQTHTRMHIHTYSIPPSAHVHTPPLCSGYVCTMISRYNKNAASPTSLCGSRQEPDGSRVRENETFEKNMICRNHEWIYYLCVLDRQSY